jgi:hypothetical protein
MKNFYFKFFFLIFRKKFINYFIIIIYIISVLKVILLRKLKKIIYIIRIFHRTLINFLVAERK